MNLLDGIERLINEHGSSTILRERIALANDKYALLESKVAALEQQVKNLESENRRLRVDLEKAEMQIKDFSNRKLSSVPIVRG